MFASSSRPSTAEAKLRQATTVALDKILNESALGFCLNSCTVGTLPISLPIPKWRLVRPATIPKNEHQKKKNSVLINDCRSHRRQ